MRAQGLFVWWLETVGRPERVSKLTRQTDRQRVVRAHADQSRAQAAELQVSKVKEQDTSIGIWVPLTNRPQLRPTVQQVPQWLAAMGAKTTAACSGLKSTRSLARK